MWRASARAELAEQTQRLARGDARPTGKPIRSSPLCASLGLSASGFHVGSDVFAGATNATVYYLPGTTGWGPTFAGRPAVLWNPLVDTADPNFGVRRTDLGSPSPAPPIWTSWLKPPRTCPIPHGFQ